MVDLSRYNPQWGEGYAHSFPKKRDMFFTLREQVENPLIAGLIGLRRTGKTIILKQLMDDLIEQGIPRHRILYYSFDDDIVPIKEIFQDYITRVGVDIEKMDRTYVFLDEVQKLDNWQNQIKFYYDAYRNIKFFVSGSSSLFLRKKAEESLAGRIFLFQLPVLSFREFLILKDENGLLKNPDLVREDMMKQTQFYMRRQFPELVTSNEDFIELYIGSIINKIVFEDLPKVFPIEYDDALKRLIGIMANNPGIITDYETMSNEIGLSRKTLSNYLSYLERGFVLQKCYNFSRNRLTSEKKMKRLYLSNTTFVLTTPEAPEIGKVVENLVLNATGARFFWRLGNKEVDAVVIENDVKLIPIESKFKSRVSKKDIGGLLSFMKRFDVDRGIVVTKDLEESRDYEGKKIDLVPLWKWLLSISGNR